MKRGNAATTAHVITSQRKGIEQEERLEKGYDAAERMKGSQMEFGKNTKIRTSV